MRNTIIPCPSPRNTNYERLFIIRKPARMAMDEAMGDPPDNGSGDGGARDAFETFAKFLQENLNPNVYAEGEAMLLHLIEKLREPETDETTLGLRPTC